MTIGPSNLSRKKPYTRWRLLNPENDVFSGLPLHEYAANAGSTQMNGVAGQEWRWECVPYHHISLENIAKERQAGKKNGNILVKLAVPLAIMVGIGALVPAYQSRNELQASITQLQADIAQANAQYNQVLESANHAKSIEDSISEIEAQYPEN